jgi:hypothetical protein
MKPTLPPVEFEFHPEGWHRATIMYSLTRKTAYYLSKAPLVGEHGVEYAWFPVHSFDKFDKQESDYIAAAWRVRMGQLVVE